MSAMGVGTLRFIENDGHCSIYQDRDGNEIYLGAGGIRLVDIDALDLPNLAWHWHRDGKRSWLFFDHVRTLLIEPDQVDDYFICEDCTEPEHNDNQVHADNKNLCESCIYNNYSMCNCCEEYAATTNSTLHGECVCDSCLDYRYSWCDECDGYYHGDYAGDHDHSSECTCESPAQEFKIRNGSEFLLNDTEIPFTLPSGVISDTGMREISQLIRAHAYTISDKAYCLSEEDPEREKLFTQHRAHIRLSNRLFIGDDNSISPEWQTKDGNFTKRLSRLAYKGYSIKIDNELMSAIGNTARAHSGGSDFQVAITRNLNMDAGHFAHEDSCWWQSYSAGRCALKSCGGFALRSFSEEEGDSYYDDVSGRAWVMPLAKQASGSLQPTFNAETPDAYVVFNGYSMLGGYIPARVIGQMVGMSYTKVEMYADPMFINGNSAYLVADEPTLAQYQNSTLILRVDAHSDLFSTERVMAHA